MLKHSIVRVTSLAAALFVAMVMSAECALAVRVPDPGAVGETASAPAPSSGFEFFGQSWQLALAVVVASVAVVALAVIVTRQHRVAQA